MTDETPSKPIYLPPHSLSGRKQPSFLRSVIKWGVLMSAIGAAVGGLYVFKVKPYLENRLSKSSNISVQADAGEEGIPDCPSLESRYRERKLEEYKEYYNALLECRQKKIEELTGEKQGLESRVKELSLEKPAPPEMTLPNCEAEKQLLSDCETRLNNCESEYATYQSKYNKAICQKKANGVSSTPSEKVRQRFWYDLLKQNLSKTPTDVAEIVNKYLKNKKTVVVEGSNREERTKQLWSFMCGDTLGTKEEKKQFALQLEEVYPELTTSSYSAVRFSYQPKKIKFPK